MLASLPVTPAEQRMELLRDHVPDKLLPHCLCVVHAVHDVPELSRKRARSSVVLVAQTACTLGVRLLCGESSLQVADESSLFFEAVQVVGALVATRITDPLLNLWHPALQDFCELILYSMPKIYVERKDEKVFHNVWMSVFEGIKWLLSLEPTTEHGEDPAIDEEWDIKLLDLFCSAPLATYALTDDVRWNEVISLLRDGITRWTPAKEHFAKACYVRLFLLCSQSIQPLSENHHLRSDQNRSEGIRSRTNVRERSLRLAEGASDSLFYSAAAFASVVRRKKRPFLLALFRFLSCTLFLFMCCSLRSLTLSIVAMRDSLTLQWL